MKTLSRKQYREYKAEAVRRGDDVYGRTDAQALFQASFYEADKAVKREQMIQRAGIMLAGILFSGAVGTATWVAL